jgi:hypothetical protein
VFEIAQAGLEVMRLLLSEGGSEYQYDSPSQA